MAELGELGELGGVGGVGELAGCSWRAKVGGSRLRREATASRSNVEGCFDTARESGFGKKGEEGGKA